MEIMTRKTATRWMKANVADYVDDCGEVNCTLLAESCCQYFDENHVGGPLDDEIHWVWDCAVDVAEKHK